MRVVSQNRGFSFDFDRTIFWVQYNVIYAKVGAENIVVGKYESDERAAEVFDDIHKAYSGDTILFKNVEISEDLSERLRECNTNCIFTRLPGEQPKIEKISNPIYYMPEV